jgi:hypothetical protein
MTCTLVLAGLVALTEDTKVEALSTSRVVTPNIRLGSHTFARLNTSDTMGTVELTGFEMTNTCAFGAVLT